MRTYRSVPTPEFAAKAQEALEIKTLEVADITALTNEQINDLKVGDLVAKVDSTGKHTYVVSYKKDKVGICLTYTDAENVETVSYDYTAENWVYNSTDITHLNEKELPAQLGTAGQVLTVNEQATGVEWKDPSGGGDIIEITSTMTWSEFKAIAKPRPDYMGGSSYCAIIHIQDSQYNNTTLYFGKLTSNTISFLDNAGEIRQVTNISDSANVIGIFSAGSDVIHPSLPSIPNDASEKTYVLKAVNGTLTWVEEA